MAIDRLPLPAVPWFGVRKFARSLQGEVRDLRTECQELREQLNNLGGLTVLELEARRVQLEAAIASQQPQLEQERSKAEDVAKSLESQIQALRKALVVTEDVILLQEAGVYQYRHPLSEAVAYERELATLWDEVKRMTKKDGGAVLAATNWTVNGSATEGRAMVRDFSKLMLRAFNAEADNLVRGLKPYKLAAAIERLAKKSHQQSNDSVRLCRFAFRPSILSFVNENWN